ncbi:MAG: aminoacyl--tRNA ligase-related protein [Patescibacteria group bacterium]
MRQSKLFTKTRKEAPKDEVSLNAQLLLRGGFVEKQTAGVYNYLPLGLRVLNKIQNIIRQEINAVGGVEILMPTLTQAENYKATGRDKTMAEVLFSTNGQNEALYYLNPTHEEIVTPLIKNFVQSYRDLPISVYQIQNKFRNEARAKSGILRGREFSMKDLYSFHATELDLDEYYEKVKEAYFKIYQRVGIGEKTYLTYASGGTFSKYSHEFQTLCEAGEDIIYICDKCHIAINKEIIEEQNSCPVCGNSELKTDKAIEVGNIFKQKTKFTEPFSLKFTDEDGVEKPVQMAAYGIGPSRIMGTIVEISHDEKGIIWPEEIAPFKFHLLNLGKDKEAFAFADDLYREMQTRGWEVLFDDRDDSAGIKLNDSDLLGIPYRIVVSSKTMSENCVELKLRSEALTKLIKIADFWQMFE